jgi:hypothetical protein
MSRLKQICFIVLFLNTWAGSERSFSSSGDLVPGPLTRSLARLASTETHSGKSRLASRGSLADRSLASLQATSPEARGAALARQIEDRDSAKDARIAMRMRLFDRQQRVRERALTLISMRGGAGRPVPGDRSLMRFTYPNDIKGTAFLVWEQPSADDERFLYLPSLGRVRRIAGSEAQESFVGSDFTYEDIGGREFEEYSYRVLEGSAVPATWTAPDGSTHPVTVLESTSRDPGARFPRVVSLVRRDNFIVVRAEIRNRRDEVQKTFEAVRVEKISGYWTVAEMRMSDAVQRTRTELVLEKVEYDVGLKPDDFSRRELERGGGWPPPTPRAGVR